jgi:hypothetical protein
MNIKLLLVPINFKLSSSTQRKYPAKHKAMTSYWIKTVAVRKRVADNLIYTKNAVISLIWIRIQNYVTQDDRAQFRIRTRI